MHTHQKQTKQKQKKPLVPCLVLETGVLQMEVGVNDYIFCEHVGHFTDIIHRGISDLGGPSSATISLLSQHQCKSWPISSITFN